MINEAEEEVTFIENGKILYACRGESGLTVPKQLNMLQVVEYYVFVCRP